MSDDLSGRWTRREFVRGAAGVVALCHLPHAAAATRRPRFAYVASGQGSIHVFCLQGEAWRRIQRVPATAPACILLSPTERTLYVANEVDTHQGLPRGTVETFRIGPSDGRLTLLGRQALSLSATRPRNMAVSPDGKLLAVAAYGGGVYNLLPIADDGSLGEPNSIFKQTGCGPNEPSQASAHPHTLLFDTTGHHLLSSDFGSDRLSVFAIEDGRLQRRTQHPTGAGSGPGACALHPHSPVLYAWHELESMLVCYRYDRVSAAVGATIQRVSFAAGSLHSLALDASGRVLYTAQGNRNELQVWHIDAENGLLARAQRVSLGETTPTRIMAAPDGEGIFILDGVHGGIYKMPGELHSKTEVAAIKEPRGMALKTI